jgi:colanic acid/amylovoran biosynthesis glycosyltransferase
MSIDRVVYAADFLPTYVLREVLELASAGVDVEVMLPCSSATADMWKDVIQEHMPSDRVHVHRVLPYHVLSCNTYKLLLLYFRMGLPVFLRHPVRFIRNSWTSISNRSFRYFLLGVSLAASLEKKPRLVHAHFAETAANASIWTARLLGVPFTVTTHAIDIFRPVDVARLVRLLNDSDRIFTISHFNVRYISKRYGRNLEDRITVTHLGLDISSLPVRTGEVNRTPLLLCTASGLGEKKGVSDLISSCERLRERGIQFRCRIVGSDTSGELLESYRSEVEVRGLGDVLEFSGLLPSEDVLKLLASCDLFILPCIEAEDGNMDGIPVSLMESMAMGVPTISTRLSGIPELIEHGRSGILVQPGEPDDLAGAIESLLLDRARAEEYGRAGAEKVRDEFEISGYVEQLLACWSRMVMQ